MARLKWDEIGKKTYETGVSNVVLFPSTTDAKHPYANGVAWSGCTAVNENPSGGESTDLYADNIVYLTMRSAEKYGATIEAYTYPDEFAECNGEKEIATGMVIKQQTRKPFGLAYTTILGNDLQGEDYGKILHIVYGCSVSPSEKSHQTVNENPEASTMSWTVSSTPVPVTGYKNTSVVEVNSVNVGAEKFKAVEDIIFGTAETESRIPMPDELKELLAAG